MVISLQVTRIYRFRVIVPLTHLLVPACLENPVFSGSNVFYGQLEKKMSGEHLKAIIIHRGGGRKAPYKPSKLKFTIRYKIFKESLIN